MTEYNALKQGKQAEAVRREFVDAWLRGRYALAARIQEANPDLDLSAALARQEGAA